MNVFVLSTGRCGSTTFARACEHMTSHTCGHETLSRRDCVTAHAPYASLHYPDNHIEVDNRLSWFLGKLDETYGQNAYYVHLLRDPEAVARSFATRWDSRHPNIIGSYAWGVLKHNWEDVRAMPENARLEIARDYCRTVNENIRFFLKDKPHQMTMWLHDIATPFQTFWKEINAEGDLQAALAEWQIAYNAGPPEKKPAAKPVEQADAPGIETVQWAVPAAMADMHKEDLSWIDGSARGWTLAPDALRFLSSLVRRIRPRHILEFGSGLSTQVLLKSCARCGIPCSITSVDHDPVFVETTEKALSSHADCDVRLQHAPVVARQINGAHLPVYHLDPAAFASKAPADLILIDGPPVVLGGREGVLYQALEYARPGTLMLLDDAARPEEQAALRRWESALGDAVDVHIFPKFERGLAAIVVHKPVHISHVWKHRFDLIAKEIETLVPQNEAVILVDEDQWPFGDSVSGRKRIPFLEKNGAYWGPPTDSAAGVRELERLRKSGAHFIVFTWPAFWWLDHYAEFGDHLRTSYRCLRQNNRLVAFDLRS